MSDTYKNGPEGMPRVKRMSDSTLDSAIYGCPLDALVRNERSYEQLHNIAHAVAEEVLARLPAWPAASNSPEIEGIATPPTSQAVDSGEGRSIDSAEFRQRLRSYHDEASYGSARQADNSLIAHIDQHVAAAVAAKEKALNHLVSKALGFGANEGVLFGWDYLEACMKDCARAADAEIDSVVAAKQAGKEAT